MVNMQRTNKHTYTRMYHMIILCQAIILTNTICTHRITDGTEYNHTPGLRHENSRAEQQHPWTGKDPTGKDPYHTPGQYPWTGKDPTGKAPVLNRPHGKDPYQTPGQNPWTGKDPATYRPPTTEHYLEQYNTPPPTSTGHDNPPPPAHLTTMAEDTKHSRTPYPALPKEATKDQYDNWLWLVSNHLQLQENAHLQAVWNTDNTTDDYVPEADLNQPANKKMYAILVQMCKDNVEISDMIQDVDKNKREGRHTLNIMNDHFKLSTTDMHQLLVNLLGLTLDPSKPKDFEHKFTTLVRQIAGGGGAATVGAEMQKTLILQNLPPGDFYLTFRQNQTQASSYNTKTASSLMKDAMEAIAFHQKIKTTATPESTFATRETPNPNPGLTRKQCKHCTTTGRTPSNGHTDATCWALHPELRLAAREARELATKKPYRRKPAQTVTTAAATSTTTPTVFNFMAGTPKIGNPDLPGSTMALVARRGQTPINTAVAILDPGATMTITNTLDPKRGVHDYRPHPLGQEIYVQCGKGIPTPTMGHCRITQTFANNITTVIPALYDPHMVMTLVASGAYLTDSKTGRPTGATITLSSDKATINLTETHTITAPKHADGLFHLHY
jgi:hypothetical protein